MYIEGILERLNLQDHISEEGYCVLDGTIGEWLEHHDKPFLNYFISTATGKYLDFIGKEHDLVRRENESDDSYRERILIEMRIVDSTTDIMGTGVTLWIYDENVLNGDEYLTSKNVSLKENSSHVFLGHADDLTREYIDGKFLVQGEIIWF